MATLFIDNKPFDVKPGKTLLETCLTLGLDLPYFCWHPALGSVGACRQCAIKMFKDENDHKGRLVMSCMEPVTDNQRISLQDTEAVQFRANVIESLMTNHPHDCAVCDEGGACHLQDMTVMSGHNYRAFRYKKRTHHNQYLGPFINHEMNRCIQCYRCVRFYKDHAGGRDLDVFASRSNVYFGRSQDGVLENEFSGNLVEVCPTGVFTDKTLKQHYTRKWDLTMSPSVCQHCSLGCNTIAGERYGQLRMIANRYNGDVNGYFICDRGRFGYEFVNAAGRIRTARLRGMPVTRNEVLPEVKKLLASAKVIGIGSPRASLQSNFALKTLVGKDNFYHGVSDNEHDLAELAIKILKEGPARTPSIREVESADAVLVLGEDLTNTAPMLAMAVRQSARRQPMQDAAKAHIPEWHDTAVREIVQERKGPVFLATIAETKLDDVATATYRSTPDDIARLGFAIARCVDAAAPGVSKLSAAEQELAQQIADALMKAVRPVIISGASCESECVMKAAANIAWALHKRNPQAGIVFTIPECNSMGLAMVGGHRLLAAFEAVLNGHADTVIIVENDLYRHAPADKIDAFLHKCKRVIVMDHTETATTMKADLIIPAGTFAESDGILVSNEGRAQRFFQVYESTEVIQESWRWLMMMGNYADHERMKTWRNFEDVTNVMALVEPLLKGVDQVTPAADFRVSGQRIPREPHRYSGRTAMNANINVSEPKPPEDPDSPLSYTMEGLRALPPSNLIPFFWAPGWNSVQSVNKYQEEVGAALRGGNPGVRLLEPMRHSQLRYFTAVPEIFQQLEDHLWVVPLHHIYGSEELSAQAPAVAERVVKPYVLVSAWNARELMLNEGQTLAFDIESQSYALPVKISATLKRNVIGLPYGLAGVPYTELPAWAIVKSPIHITVKAN
jgi:NADH-quinone oxidoreductase subunit G